MPTLRISQTSLADGQHQVQLDLQDHGAPQSAFSQFAFALTDQDREDVRWYLEDYLQYPIDPAPIMAEQVEQRMRALGGELYAHLFDGNPAARRLWARLEPELAGMRVEVATEVDADAVLPWELLHDPHSNTDLAVHVNSFVRVQRQTARPATLSEVGTGETIRVLLVICRPGGRQDVPFRSVASHLVRLSAKAREVFHLEVLRPPTFGQLALVLRQAAARGEPYHVVHFDGHGTWRQLRPDHAAPTVGGAASNWSPLRYAEGDPRPGPRGYLLFEKPATKDNREYVDGARLGNLLAETGVPVLVLNACQSAHADLTPTPQDAAAAATDVQTRVRAYGSLAQEVVDAGVAGVVAMRYSVYVVTAAQFIADLYAALLDGLPLGQAVTMGRKQLATQPDREIAFAARPLQDWVVPVVYETAPLELFSKPRTDEQLRISVDQTQAGRERSELAAGVPTGPDVGFYGRDESLLALDRAFDGHQIVLLHAFAGAGKTSTAVEFARWYQHTGGSQGPVLLTSFEHHLPLARVLDQLGSAFDQPLEQAGVHWLALDELRRRQVALEVLAQIPVLWIWDNVEPVAGFPQGSPSAWSAEEQAELIGFLHAVQDTKAKVLMTSRREENGWLGELPARVKLPPMPMAERVQLARAIATRHGHRLADVEDWRPLLDYTQGNPLTLTVLVGQALRNKVRTPKQMDDFVAQLRAGEAQLKDDQRQGRSQSLGASLAYGFQTAFSNAEQAELAVLRLFQGTVDVDVLCYMGDPDIVGDAALPALSGLSRETGIELLDRATEVGLLTPIGQGYYTIHPALPWHFAELFTIRHGKPDSPAAAAARLAYTRAMANLGNNYKRLFDDGQREAVVALKAEEANLLHGLGLARANGWWDEVIGTLQGLRILYRQTGRWVEWARLVETITPELVDVDSGQPLPGRENQWIVVTDYRIGLAERALDWATAIHLQRSQVAWTRQEAEAALAADPASLDFRQRIMVRNLSSALEGLARVLREQKQPDCVQASSEALELRRRIGDRAGEATAAYNLGRAYRIVPAIQDLDQAERWYQYSLDLRDPEDRLGRAFSTNSLGAVQLDRFDKALGANKPEDELLSYLNAALDAYQRGLQLTPSDAVQDLAVSHNQLGATYQRAGQIDNAMRHYRDAVRYHEIDGNRYRAAQVRNNVAILLLEHGRPDHAQVWAQAALTDYKAVGTGAADRMANIEQLLATIEQVLAGRTSHEVENG
jgi:tetratricopeptide (TPR) repeat protein